VREKHAEQNDLKSDGGVQEGSAGIERQEEAGKSKKEGEAPAA